MQLEVVQGDLLDQDVDVIVNAWNRNVIPWWLLLPSGVSGAIKKRAGKAPFREVARAGWMPLGTAVLTGAGKLPHRGIIHVAGIDLTWRSSERAVADSVRSAMAIAREQGFGSIAFPVIGAGAGGVPRKRALAVMKETLAGLDFDGLVRIVEWTATKGRAVPLP